MFHKEASLFQNEEPRLRQEWHYFAIWTNSEGQIPSVTLLMLCLLEFLVCLQVVFGGCCTSQRSGFNLPIDLAIYLVSQSKFLSVGIYCGCLVYRGIGL